MIEDCVCYPNESHTKWTTNSIGRYVNYLPIKRATFVITIEKYCLYGLYVYELFPFLW